jgi:hypothetical protein
MAVVELPNDFAIMHELEDFPSLQDGQSTGTLHHRRAIELVGNETTVTFDAVPSHPNSAAGQLAVTPNFYLVEVAIHKRRTICAKNPFSRYAGFDPYPVSSPPVAHILKD